MIEAHIAHPVNGGFDVLYRIPRQLAVGNQRQLLVKLIVKLEEIIKLLVVDSNSLLVQVLLQLITLAIGDQRRGPAGDGALNRLTHKAAVADLSHGDLINVAAALGTDLNQSILSKFDKSFTNRLARDVKPHRYLFLRQRRAGGDQAMYDILAQDTVNLLINGQYRIKVGFDGHALLLNGIVTRLPYHLFDLHPIPGPQAG